MMDKAQITTYLAGLKAEDATTINNDVATMFSAQDPDNGNDRDEDMDTGLATGGPKNKRMKMMKADMSGPSNEVSRDTNEKIKVTRANCEKLVVVACEFFYRGCYGIPVSGEPLNIDRYNEMCTVVRTLHTILRQMHNGSSAMQEKMINEVKDINVEGGKKVNVEQGMKVLAKLTAATSQVLQSPSFTVAAPAVIAGKRRAVIQEAGLNMLTHGARRAAKTRIGGEMNIVDALVDEKKRLSDLIQINRGTLTVGNSKFYTFQDHTDGAYGTEATEIITFDKPYYFN